jgi:hypothetical protein
MAYKMKVSKCGCGIKVSRPKMDSVSIKKPDVIKEVKGKEDLEKLVLRENPKKYVSFR